MNGTILPIVCFEEDEMLLAGAGIIVIQPGWLLTCSHLFEAEGGDYEYAVAYKHGDKNMLCKLSHIKSDETKDLALLQLKYVKDMLPFQFRNTNKKQFTNREMITTYGYSTPPNSGDTQPDSYSGQVLQHGNVDVTADKHPARNFDGFICDFALPHGFSGGPAIDENGLVVGIHSFTMPWKEDACESTVSAHISVQEIELFLSSSNSS